MRVSQSFSELVLNIHTDDMIRRERISFVKYVDHVRALGNGDRPFEASRWLLFRGRKSRTLEQVHAVSTMSLHAEGHIFSFGFRGFPRSELDINSRVGMSWAPEYLAARPFFTLSVFGTQCLTSNI
jgi:hypothetical protein